MQQRQGTDSGDTTPRSGYAKLETQVLLSDDTCDKGETAKPVLERRKTPFLSAFEDKNSNAYRQQKRRDADDSLKIKHKKKVKHPTEVEIAKGLSKERAAERASEHPPSCTMEVIDPHNSRWLNAWDICIAILLVCVAIVSPFETAFLEPKVDTMFFLNRMVDLAFMLDMVVQCFLPFPDPDHSEHLVTQHHLIIKRYLRGWFWIDFCSVLPIDIYCVIVKSEGPNNVRLIRIVKLLRLIRLLRLAKFQRLMDRWHTSFGISYSVISLGQFLCMGLLCCHWMACLWGAIALNSGDQSWLGALRAAKGGSDELYSDAWSVYCISVYWAIVTLTSIGYGDITPQCITEYCVAGVCLSVMASVWAYVIGAVVSIVSTLQPHEIDFKRTMDDLNWLMADWDVEQPMRERLRTYFHESKDSSRYLMQKQIMAQLSPRMQAVISMKLHKTWIDQVRYLKDAPVEVIVLMVQKLQAKVFAPHEEILAGLHSLCIVRRGICAKGGKIYGVNEVWGEDMVIQNKVLRDRTTCRALGFLDLFMVRLEDLQEIAEDYPDLSKSMVWTGHFIAMKRAIVLIHRVMRELAYFKVVYNAEIGTGQRLRLVTEILKGTIDGKIDASPGQVNKIRSLLMTVIEKDLDRAPVQKSRQRSASPRDRDAKSSEE
eukprot:gnl/TRDRNA2_/TRDRNA2_174203_c9_seq4.p1 gnl/TRDRNA2_/TRDRNA2_174203_c9~~gnl/TRDRNA2_/TRDRNA2_174203_c9_seq4.p1  ORF type:complete len:655 (+),score=110.58 gnl/TRDRNA2_/TRDRNA2_174203_c9_seq4:111-2075(+)